MSSEAGRRLIPCSLLARHDEADDEDQEWDGIVLSHFVICPNCEAIDDYELESWSRMRLSAQAIAGRGGGRVIVGEMRMWDGTVARRPSHSIAHLRQLVERNPESGEACRRLGNTLERFEQPEEAIEMWQRACDRDDTEFEAAFSLAQELLLRDDPERSAEGFGWLRRA